jgi:hypothetical protein
MRDALAVGFSQPSGGLGGSNGLRRETFDINGCGTSLFIRKLSCFPVFPISLICPRAEDDEGRRKGQGRAGVVA